MNKFKKNMKEIYENVNTNGLNIANILADHNLLVKKYKKVIIQPTALLIDPSKIFIGEGSWIGSYSNLRPVNNKIIIGKNVLIAQMVSIISDQYDYKNIDLLIKKSLIKGKDVVIEDDVWIGTGSIILPGVNIGKHSVVGAGSVVTKSIPQYCVAVGNPAKIKKRYSFKLKKWFKYSLLIKLFFKLNIL